jgi:hypothetical protein
VSRFLLVALVVHVIVSARKVRQPREVRLPLEKEGSLPPVRPASWSEGASRDLHARKERR